MKATATRTHPFEANGRRIKKIRKPVMSQERLAEVVGVTRRHMIRLENGQHLPSAELRNAIADACGVSRELIQSCEDEEEDSSMPLSRGDAQLLSMFGELLQRLQVTTGTEA